ncbi:MAG: hypothetical protein AAB472_03005 [Patescibacteria group bacterium]
MEKVEYEDLSVGLGIVALVSGCFGLVIDLMLILEFFGLLDSSNDLYTDMSTTDYTIIGIGLTVLAAVALPLSIHLGKLADASAEKPQ